MIASVEKPKNISSEQEKTAPLESQDFKRRLLEQRLVEVLSGDIYYPDLIKGASSLRTKISLLLKSSNNTVEESTIKSLVESQEFKNMSYFKHAASGEDSNISNILYLLYRDLSNFTNFIPEEKRKGLAGSLGPVEKLLGAIENERDNFRYMMQSN
jgi:hypothetical protein